MLKLKQVILTLQRLAVQRLAIVTLAVFFVAISPVAAANQSNQDINQPALLIAPEPEFQISVYPKPDGGKRRIGYGLGGDAVTVIEQVGSNEGYTWNHVRFDRSPNLEGWIREEFISLQENDRANPPTSIQSFDQNRQPTSSRPGNHNKEYQNTNQNNSYQNQRQYQDNYNQKRN